MPAAPFHVKLVLHAPGVVIVEVAGEVDMHTAQELDDALTNARSGDMDRLIVDLAAVGFIDSVGLSVLVQNAKLVLAGGALFEIVGVSSRLLQVFALTGIRDVLTFHPTREEALR
jgi:anti-sigma B factor antagonist